MKIVIVGPGALGLLLAGLLSKTKEEVWILDKDKDRACLISRNGIKVEGISGSWDAAFKATHEADKIGKVDLVIITVKAYDTKSAVLKCKPIVGADTYVLTLQNGIGNIEVIAEEFGEEKVLGGVTNMGSTLIDQVRIRHAGKGETVIGRMDGKLPVEMKRIRDVFTKAGLELKFSRDIKSLIWSKLIINVGINALTAITRLPNGKLVEFEGSRKILREAVTEAIRVAKRKRIKLAYDDPLAKVEAVCEATSSNIASMLQDILKKKRTEIDFINGVIVRQAQELRLSVPVNALLVDLVKTIEASYNVQK
ncbi:MAG: 2-dehydropantoate 2-reductase [Candidatus Omnitrophica bacterium]|nr:2-dehydropantoate 2-reductase [Candidatus Omnitrophota bacterium]